MTKYIDDILVHSACIEEHSHHLRQVFERLQQAGLTLRGRKCRIGMKEVPYLGHIFTGNGMSPDVQKVKAVLDWPVPANVTDVCKFLGLASYYRRYVLHFSDIAAPLHELTQKGEAFIWNERCQTAFNTLKQKLVQAPVLGYPNLSQNASPFILQMDASASGLGAVLEQDGRVMGYASRTLNQVGTKLQCHPERMLGSCLCNQAISSLSPWSSLPNSY